MKRLSPIIIALIATGCATDGLYDAGKAIYVSGKRVVIENWDSLPKKTKERLKNIDEIATRYDAARKVIKPALVRAKKNLAKQGSDVAEKSASGLSVGGRR